MLATAGIGGAAWHWYASRVPDRVYRVGYEPAPILVQEEPGKPLSGLAIELLQESARRKGIRMEFVRFHKPSLDTALAEGKVDLWFIAFDMPERRAKWHAVEPWLNHRSYLVARADAGIQSEADLAGKRVVVPALPLLTDWVKRMAPTAIPIPVFTNGLVRVCAGEGDATILEERFIEASLTKRPLACEGLALTVRYLPDPIQYTSYARPEAAAAANALRDGIGDLVRDGTYLRIVSRWSAFGAQEFRQMQTVLLARDRLQLQWAFTGAVTILLGLLLLQNWRLRRARRAAQIAAEAKASFLAMMSHEIRTPINGVLGMSQMLLSAPLEPRDRQAAQTIYDSAEGLLTILNDVLDYSKMEAGKFKIEAAPFDVRALVAQTVAAWRRAAEEKGLQMEVTVAAEVPEALLGDAGRLRQILLNLVSNAVKFTNDGYVRLEVGRTEAGRMVFSVTDSGVGIAEAKWDQLFERFQQIDYAGRAVGGTGLGLAICRQLAVLMGGEIRFHSQEGRGSTFLVELPLPQAETPVPDAKPSPLEDDSICFPGAAVLLVDDNGVNLRVGERLLERLGATVTAASGGVQALDLLSQQRFDLVLLDCQMPDLDGFQVTRRLRAGTGQNARTPVIALTAAVLDESRQKAQEAGMDDFLSKPVRLEELRRAMSRWLPVGPPQTSPAPQ